MKVRSHRKHLQNRKGLPLRQYHRLNNSVSVHRCHADKSPHVRQRFQVQKRKNRKVFCHSMISRNIRHHCLLYPSCSCRAMHRRPRVRSRIYQLKHYRPSRLWQLRDLQILVSFWNLRCYTQNSSSMIFQTYKIYPLLVHYIRNPLQVRLHHQSCFYPHQSRSCRRFSCDNRTDTS